MKPYGLGNKIKFPAKRDVHPKKGWKNWWEDIQDLISRSTAKIKLKNEIDRTI